MKNIASQLGLSRTTVSLVMQGRGDEYRISRATQALVRARVTETDFRPNYFARALTSGKSAVIGAIFPDVFEPFMSNLIRGMETVLYERDFSLTISTSRFDLGREQALVEKTVWQGADGIILVPTMPFNDQTPYDSSHISPLLDLGYPLVVVDRTIPGLATHRVVQNDYGMARKALEGLMADLGKAGDSRGKRRRLCIPCVSFDLTASSVRTRIQAYADVMKYAGLATDTIFLGRMDPDSTDLADAVRQRQGSAKTPDAWFVTTAGLAEKLSWLLRRRNSLPIPPIVRFGSSSRWLDSSFIDIPQPHEKMGMAAARFVLDLIDAKTGTIVPSDPEEKHPGPDGMIEIRC